MLILPVDCTWNPCIQDVITSFDIFVFSDIPRHIQSIYHFGIRQESSTGHLPPLHHSTYPYTSSCPSHHHIFSHTPTPPRRIFTSLHITYITSSSPSTYRKTHHHRIWIYQQSHLRIIHDHLCYLRFLCLSSLLHTCHDQTACAASLSVLEQLYHKTIYVFWNSICSVIYFISALTGKRSHLYSDESPSVSWPGRRNMSVVVTVFTYTYWLNNGTAPAIVNVVFKNTFDHV